MNRRSILILLIFSTLVNRVFPQSSFDPTSFSYATSQMNYKEQRVIPPSPDAAELGRYGNVPVSLYTGTPKVSIPLYDLKGNNFDLPISLSYNAGGFRPQDLASWVGLGWTLNAGGVITRSVVANPDNATNYFFQGSSFSTPPSTVNNLFANYGYMDSIQRGYIEAQPDVYYYNFGSYTGKFFLDPNGNVIRKEKSDLKIWETNVPSDATGASSFTIVDGNGNTYQFAATEISNLTLNDAVSQQTPAAINYVYPSSWFLTSITSADNQEQVLFTYYTAASYQTQYNNFVQGGSYSWYHNTLVNSSYLYESSSGANLNAPPTVAIYYRKYLQGITYVKGGATIATITLNTLTNQRQDLSHTDYPDEQLLQGIKISSATGLVKQYSFYYSYFTNSLYTDPYHMRLRLDSVSEQAVDGSGLYKPPYSFVYNNGGVPSVGQASLDSWGFYNGFDMVSNLIPTYILSDGFNYGGSANRSPSLTACSMTTLSSINYPTGGYTSFVYELNQANNINTGTAVPVGGVRIKQMFDYPSGGQPAVVRNYQYLLSNGTSSGVASFPTNTSTNTFDHYAQVVLGGCGTGNNQCSNYFLNFLNVSANSVYGLGTFQGSHIAYSLVTEFESDPNTGSALGQTVYSYYVAANPSSYDDNLANGELLEKTVYNANGKMLDDVLNTYNYQGPSDGALEAFTVSSQGTQDDNYELCQYLSSGDTLYSWIQPGAGSPTCIANEIWLQKLYYSGYVLSSQCIELTQTTDTRYDQQTNANTVMTKKYTYGDAAITLPTLIEDYSSENDEVATIKRYAADYTVPVKTAVDNNSAGIRLLQAYNMLGKEIETVQYRQNLNGTNQRFIGGVLNFYSPVFPYLTNISHLELTAPLTTIQASSVTNGTFTYDPNYVPLAALYYDNYGNLAEQIKTAGKAKSYIWDYQGLLPTAEVMNATPSLIAYTGFESGTGGGNWSGFSSSYIAAGGIAGNNSYNLASPNTLSVITLQPTRQFVVSCWVHSGSVSVTTNIGTATGVAGATYLGWTYYEYLLPASSTQVTVSSSGANIDELRLFPKDAQMTTYTYTPLVGMTSKCSVDNHFLYYTYDGLGRLRYIKDQSGNIVKTYEYHYQGH
jgi:hypothetical protein